MALFSSLPPSPKHPKIKNAPVCRRPDAPDEAEPEEAVAESPAPRSPSPRSASPTPTSPPPELTMDEDDPNPFFKTSPRDPAMSGPSLDRNGFVTLWRRRVDCGANFLGWSTAEISSAVAENAVYRTREASAAYRELQQGALHQCEYAAVMSALALGNSESGGTGETKTRPGQSPPGLPPAT